MVKTIASITQGARIPDQLAPYVQAVSGMEAAVCENCLLYLLDGYGVLAAWNEGQALDSPSLEKTVDAALKNRRIRHLTVIAEAAPSCMPENAVVKRDKWWFLKLPLKKPQGKLGNLLRRAERDLHVETGSGAGAWTNAHQNLASNFCGRESGNLDDGSKYIFNNLAPYLETVDNALLFSAYDRAGELHACAIGDFSAFSTAFYMFAFRKQNAIPGAADLLVSALVQEAEKRGMSEINMGLGINPGIEFFKKKWGALPLHEHVESAWKVSSGGFFSRLSKILNRKEKK